MLIALLDTKSGAGFSREKYMSMDQRDLEAAVAAAKLTKEEIDAIWTVERQPFEVF